MDAKETIRVRQVGRSTHIIDVRGDVSAGAEEALFNAYRKASEQGAQQVILNLTGLEYLNSYGIALFITLLKQAREQGQRLLSYGLKGHYRDIFALTRLNQFIPMFDHEAEALAAAD